MTREKAANLSRDAILAAHQPPVGDDAGADAEAQQQDDERGKIADQTAQVKFGDGSRIGVIFDPERPAHLDRENVPQGRVAPAGQHIHHAPTIARGGERRAGNRDADAEHSSPQQPVTIDQHVSQLPHAAREGLRIEGISRFVMRSDGRAGKIHQRDI